MPLRFAQRLAALVAVGLIAGCADRLYEQRLIEPEGATSQPCLERCARRQEECEARQTVREQECAERAAAAKADYETCSSAGSGRCPPPETCLGTDMGICQRQHEECFTDCGGRVERKLRQRPWEAPTRPQTTSSPAEQPTGSGPAETP